MRMQAEWEAIYRENESVWSKRPDPMLMHIAPRVPKGKVLDLGMGEGRNLLYFARLGYEAWGVDASQSAVQRCMDRAQALGLTVQAEASDILAVDLEPDSLTLVICTMTLPFIKKSESEPLFQKIKRGLKVGGWVYLTTFSVEDPQVPRWRQNTTEIEPNTFYNDENGRRLQFFELDELQNAFQDFTLYYNGHAIQYDDPHPGAPQPHYHGIMTYIGTKE
jgi:tellurite methyltransferase